MTRPRCRTCGSRNVVSIGPLPDGLSFAGVIQTEPLPGGTLWSCEDCHLAFRDPLLATSRYEDLYRKGSAELWESQSVRQDFRLVQLEMADDAPGMNVLDIGCYTGRLLASLPKRYRLHGVEPNEAAARIAVSRGIRIVAETVSELSLLSDKFDAIIACDIIEHLVDPLAFLGQLRAHLAPNGRLLLSTGNTDAWLWRLFGSNYWYCSFPEHISFIGRRWLQLMAGRVGLQVTRMTEFNYCYSGFNSAALRKLVGAMIYGCNPPFYRRMRERLPGGAFTAPGSGASKDHLFCVMSAL
jgi:SAM-dependent methyltransferase